MFRPTERLQSCLGVSLVILSIGGTWSMMSGSIVKFQVAGANFSVNEKLKIVEKVTEELSETTTELRNQPGVSPLKLQAIEAELLETQSNIDDAESRIESDLEELVKPKEM